MVLAFLTAVSTSFDSIVTSAVWMTSALERRARARSTLGIGDDSPTFSEKPSAAREGAITPTLDLFSLCDPATEPITATNPTAATSAPAPIPSFLPRRTAVPPLRTSGRALTVLVAGWFPYASEHVRMARRAADGARR